MRISDWSSDVCSSDLPVRVGAPSEQHLGKVSGVMAEPVHLGELRSQPSGEQVLREREAVHLREQRSDERGKHAETAPISRVDTSEERRGGEESVGTCSSGWSPYYENKNRKPLS